MLRRRSALLLIAALAVAAVVGLFFVPPLAQPLEYHEFADARRLWGVPNFWNVASNIPFLVVGFMGLAVVVRNRLPGGLPSQRMAYGIFFAGVAAVCVGSGYYHWSPSNATLVWDRLPMAIAFMALVAIVVAEHIDERAAWYLLWPLVTVGVFSVWYWYYTEQQGRGDLRLYGLVQFLSIAIVGLIWLTLPSRFTGMKYLWGMFAGYVLAKLLEEFDSGVYALLDKHMSGHALKHVAAVAGMYCFVVALRERRLVAAQLIEVSSQ